MKSATRSKTAKFPATKRRILIWRRDAATRQQSATIELLLERYKEPSLFEQLHSIG